MKEFNHIDSNGLRQGLWKVFFTNGNLSYECFYKNNKLNGLSKSYDFDGSIMDESLYKDGKKNGYSKIYYSSGLPKGAYSFKKGIRHGYFIENEYGELVIVGEFIKGKKVYIKKYNIRIKNFPTGNIKINFDKNKLRTEIIFIR